VLAVLIVVSLALAACGGSSDDEDEAAAYPPYAGAEELGTGVPPQEQLDALGVQLSDAGASLHRTDDDLATVGAFYSEEVTKDGWTVPLTVPITDAASVSVMHRDDQVAAVMIMTGSMAKLVETAITSQGLAFEPDRIQDDDVVILESHLTCDEPEIQTCLDALTAAAGQ